MKVLWNSIIQEMLKQDKSLDRTAILHDNIETLLLKLNTVQKHCFQPKIVTEVKKHINCAITITEAALANPSQCTSLLPVKKQYSPNANHEKELWFYPIKQKWEKSKSCTKPTFEEIKSTEDNLSKTDVIVSEKMINAVISMWNGFSVNAVKFGCTLCVLIKTT